MNSNPGNKMPAQDSASIKKTVKHAEAISSNQQQQDQFQTLEQKYLLPNVSLSEDAEIALENLTNQEVQLIKEAEELFKKQVVYVEHIDRLRKYVPNMERITGDTRRLSSLVESSSMLVEEVCSKFKQIDLVKMRLKDSLSKIGDILDLRTCRQGMIKAMQAHNYEEAAMHIKRFLLIDQQELEKTVSIICGGDDDRQQPRRMSMLIMEEADDKKSEGREPTTANDGTATTNVRHTIVDPKAIRAALAELDGARMKLLLLCREKLMLAIKQSDTKNIERFFKIFPMLNEHQDGLQRYSQYLQSKIMNQQVEETVNSKKFSQADKLTALYENIAKIIDEHQPLVETYYGPGHLTVVIKVIQKECDRLSRKILEEFCNETNLQQVVKVVRSSSLQIYNSNLVQNPQQGGTNLNLAPSKLDFRSVDKIVNEISLILSRSEVYLSFIVQRIRDDINSKAENESQRKARLLELYNMIFLECELNHLIQEVGGIYVMLEQFYLNESAKKAITMDHIDTDPSFPCLISSMLDDTFFLLKKCTKRALSTKSNEVFCAIINHCVTLIESTLCQVFEDRLRNQQYYTTFSVKNLDLSQAYNAIQSGRYLQSAPQLEKSNALYFSALNNLCKACEYMKTLGNLLDADVKKLKPSILLTEQKHDNQLEKSLACLNEMLNLTSRFASTINSSLYHLFNTSLRNRVKAELKTLMEENVDLPSILANNPNELSTLAENLLKTSDDCLKQNLLPENYSKLVSITKDFLLSSLKLLK